MMNVIRGIKYYSGVKELNSEEQLLDIFDYLKGIYNKIRTDFEISDSRGDKIDNFSSFLKIAVGENAQIFLTGSGEFAGLRFAEGILEYNLKDVARLTKYWDIYTRKDCYNCVHVGISYPDEDTREYRCKKILNEKRISSRTCGDNFSPKIKGINGQNPRNLEKIIDAASK